MTNNTLLNNNEKMISLLSELVEGYEQSSVHNGDQASLETLQNKMEQAKQLVNKYKQDKAKRVNEVDGVYLDLLNDILENGSKKGDRTGTGTISVFSRELRFDLKKGFPMLTTKKLPLKLIASELAWFIKGYTNIEYLLRYDNGIWRNGKAAKQ